MAIDLQVTMFLGETEEKLTRAWETKPTTYPIMKAEAVGRAKRALYGTRTVPAEASIPEIAVDWIAAKAATILIPLAIQHYMNNSQLSSTKEQATISHYDKVAALQTLQDKLEAECNANFASAMATIDADTVASGDNGIPSAVPSGMVDPVDRAYRRGPFPL